MAVGSTENLRIILTAVDNASRVLKNVSSQIDKTKSSLNKSTEGAKKFTKATALITTVVGGLTVREFASFEKQMSKVKAITGATEQEFKKMTDLAKKMGATTAFTGKEAGDALEFLGMAGLNVKQSMDALPWTLELAAAGNLSLGESADIATNIMAQYGIKAENIGRVNDVLAKSATSANTSVQEMAEAMKYLGPVANTFKIPIEEGASAVNILANNGIKGSMAGRAFASSLLRITKPTDAMTDSMNALNVTLFNQKGEYVGLTDTVRQLQEGTANMTDEQKANHITTVFGMQATKHWLTLIKEGSGEMERYTESLENAGGSAKAMAEIQLDNLSGSFTLLKSAISGAMIEIGGAISVYLRPAIDWLTSAISNWRENWNSLSPVMQSIIKATALVAGGMVAIALAVGTVSLVLAPILTAFGFLVTILGAVTTALGFVGGAFLAVGAPIVLLIASIVALGVVIALFAKNWDDIMLTIKYLTGKMKDAVIQKWEELKDSVSNILSSITDFFRDKWNEIKDTIIGKALSFIGNLIKTQFNAYATIIKGVFSIIKGIFTGDFSYIKGLVSNVTGAIKSIWSGAMSSMSSIASSVWGGIKSTISGIVSGLTSKFTSFSNTIGGIYSKVKGWLGFITGAKSTAQSNANTVQNIAGARAIGGPVSRNKTYLVGENWPEYFTPWTSGRINNNVWGGGGGAPINLYFGDVYAGNDTERATFFQEVKKVMVEVQRQAQNWYS